MVSSYTANLATFLVAPQKESAIYSVNDLADCVAPNSTVECPVRFGVKKEGATRTFFEVL